ncbi:MAG: DNA cytosine methyltransferase [Ilumatobacteraceae bacterium]
MKPTYGSLFSGVGGFDLGFDRAGFEGVFQVEWDKHCRSILERHWPDVPKWSDVQDVSGAEVPPCDVLTFGSPCQDLSIAGKQAGLGGGRSSMFFEATRIIKEMQNATGGAFPRIAVWENVPGALSSNKGDDFAVVLDEMAECGALVLEWAILDARWFGVPQRRRRVFLIAVFDPDIAGRCRSEILPVGSRSDRDPSTGKTSQQGATSATGGDFAEGVWGSCSAGGTLTPYFQTSFGDYTEGYGTLKASDHKRPEQNIVFHHDQPSDVVLSFDTQFGSNANVFTNESPTLKASQQSPSVLSMVVEQVNTTAYSIREDAKADTFSATETDTALCLNAMRPSVQSHHAQLFITDSNSDHYVIRRLLPKECERLMGWPDDWTRWRKNGIEQADTNRFKQCGNGVASPVAEWVAKQILKVM